MEVLEEKKTSLPCRMALKCGTYGEYIQKIRLIKEILDVNMKISLFGQGELKVLSLGTS